jgi:hypothetical protein
MIARLRHYLACRRLARMVNERANSFEVIDYRRRMTAALKYRRA